MNKNKIKYLYLGITLLIGVITGIIMFTLQNAHYDFESFSFNVVKTQLIPLKIIIGVFVTFLFIRPVVTKETNAVKDPSTINIVTSVLFFISFILLIVGAIGESKSTYFTVCAVLCTVFTLLSGLYFLSAFKSSETSYYLSASLPLWAVSSLAVSYFNSDYTYTDFSRLTLNLAYAMIIVFSLTEVRALIDIKYERMRLIFGHLSLYLGTVAILPRVMFIIIGKSRFNFSTAAEVAMLGALIFIFYSLLPTKKEEYISN